MDERIRIGADAARQLATLNRVARIAVQDMALRPMLQRIVDVLSEEFGWEFVACATVDHDAREFVCEAVCGDLESEVMVGYRRALGTGVVGRCAASGRTIDIADARGHPGVIDTLHGTGSELCVPVVHNGEVLAVLNAESRQVAAFTGQRELLETVADQIAGILRAASLLRQLQDANAELLKANVALESLSEMDSLTGIANRRFFDARLPLLMASTATAGEPLSLLMIDVDFFKTFNDRHGHPAGDDCLRNVAGVMSYLLEGSRAQLARYGGEEFAVLVPGADSASARALAERLRRAVEARALEHGERVGGIVTISVGVATRRSGAQVSSAGLVDDADAALYEAKRSGRNQVSVAPARD